MRAVERPYWVARVVRAVLYQASHTDTTALVATLGMMALVAREV